MTTGNPIRRQIRILRAYTVASTTLLGFLAVTAFNARVRRHDSKRSTLSGSTSWKRTDVCALSSQTTHVHLPLFFLVRRSVNPVDAPA